MDSIDYTEILTRFLKYLFEGFAVGIACYFSNLKADQIVAIAITAAVTFAIWDMYSPRISEAARLGTGIGIGSQFAGFRMVGM